MILTPELRSEIHSAITMFLRRLAAENAGLLASIDIINLQNFDLTA